MEIIVLTLARFVQKVVPGIVILQEIALLQEGIGVQVLIMILQRIVREEDLTMDGVLTLVLLVQKISLGIVIVRLSVEV